MDWDRLSRQLNKQNWMILLLLAGSSYFLMKPAFTLGVILGGFMIILNFRVLERTVQSAFSPASVMKKAKGVLIAKTYFRLAIMAGLIYALITRGWVDPVGLAIGLSIVVISIVHLGIRAAWKLSSGEAI